MKIGILGGAFDPIHNGHLSLGEYALETFMLDEVWFLPNGSPPHKYTSDSSDGGLIHRIRMIEKAIESNPSFRLSLHEARTDFTSYTYTTLQSFNKMYPTYQFYFIVGADALFSIENWKNFTEIFRRCTLLAAVRGEHNISSLVEQIKRLEDIYRGKIELLQAPKLEISSSVIRERVKSKKTISYMVPEKVELYIKENDMYGAEEGFVSHKEGTNHIVGETFSQSDLRPYGINDDGVVSQKVISDIHWYKSLTYQEQKYDLEKFEEILKSKLTHERYLHTLGVMYTAAVLAMRYQVNLFDAMTAGMLHDCGKYVTLEEQEAEVKRYNIALSDDEQQIPSLIHAPLGAYLAKNEYGVTEESILNAILYHSTGRPDMTMLEKIIYIADFIEPYRGDSWKFRMIRNLTFYDIDKAIYECAKLIIDHLEKNNRKIGEATFRTLEFYGGKNIDSN